MCNARIAEIGIVLTHIHHVQIQRVLITIVTIALSVTIAAIGTVLLV